ncbi:MAG: CidA/LrgA family protein [Pelosinus sp.]|nr:CidA/LrgA family protein [Pelosinus sp.]
MLKKTSLFVGQVLFLWLVYEAGNKIVSFFGLPIPGNVLGMILLFLMLLTGIVKVEQLALASNFLLKHITFFFIPIAVGLINWVDLFLQHILALTMMVLISAILAFYLTGFLFQYLQRRSEK